MQAAPQISNFAPIQTRQLRERRMSSITYSYSSTHPSTLSQSICIQANSQLTEKPSPNYNTKTSQLSRINSLPTLTMLPSSSTPPTNSYEEEQPPISPLVPLEEAPDFDTLQCLFCTHQSLSVELSLSHMHKSHGLFIPQRDHLVVDIETLLAYLHLVIFGYRECLACGTQRNSVEAVQQHMLGKGHCRFDIEDDESEYRDFYDFGSAAEAEEDGDEDRHSGIEALVVSVKTSGLSARPVFTQLDDSTLRLPSGKTLSHRTTRKPRPARRRAESPDSESVPLSGSSRDPSTSPTPDSGAPMALTRAEQRAADFTKYQLARLRAEDRRSLMHLPASEQRALLAVQKKQIDKARRAEWAMRGRVEGMGNKTLMKNFVNDVPGRLNG